MGATKVTKDELEFGGAWTSWTPTWTNVTVGNGTVVARYTQVGKLVTCTISFILGSTSAISGVMIFSLPVPAAARYTGAGVGLTYLGLAYVEDAGVTGAMGHFQAASTTTASLRANGTGGTYLTDNQATATVPFTWGNLDFFTGTFTYEAA